MAGTPIPAYAVFPSGQIPDVLKAIDEKLQTLYETLAVTADHSSMRFTQGQIAVYRQLKKHIEEKRG